MIFKDFQRYFLLILFIQLRGSCILLLTCFPVEPNNPSEWHPLGALRLPARALDQEYSNVCQPHPRETLLARSIPKYCPPYLAADGTLLIAPTCGILNAIELLTDKSPAYIFQKYIHTYLPVSKTGTTNNNTVMVIDTAEGERP